MINFKGNKNFEGFSSSKILYLEKFFIFYFSLPVLIFSCYCTHIENKNKEKHRKINKKEKILTKIQLTTNSSSGNKSVSLSNFDRKLAKKILNILFAPNLHIIVGFRKLKCA